MRFARETAGLRICFCRALLTCALATLVVSAPLFALNPDRRISQYAHSAWRIQDGFLGGFPYAIAQTADGYIWIATQSGIVQFDGVRFSPWNPAGTEQLQSLTVTSLLGTGDGSLWIGTLTGGAWQWKNQRLKRYFVCGSAQCF
jgi:ligand-binding sensor domain-containing protein